MFDRHLAEYKALSRQQRLQVLRQQHIIGMTTTGCARICTGFISKHRKMRHVLGPSARTGAEGDSDGGGGRDP